jgi:hypothetical protein
LNASHLISSKLLSTVEQQGVWKFLNLFKRFLRGFIMKKLSILALSLLATAAFAATPTATEVNISGTSIQAAVFDSTSVQNIVSGRDNIAAQNLASNAGAVNISGDSLQVVYARNSTIYNDASGNDNIASQNMSSNVGKVNVSGTSIQISAAVNGSYIHNHAQGRDNVATQNIASNNSCSTCVGGHN